MILWKEWRRIRGRVLTVSGFYLITAFFVPVDGLSGTYWLSVPLFLLAWAGGLGILPAILTMDLYAGEKDEGTEGFLFSKPIPFGRLILAKIGLRVVSVLLVSAVVLLVVTLRIRAAEIPFYFWVRPYVIASILAVTFAGLMTILGVTALVSIRAPYQSTALIIGGALGILVAALALYPFVDGIRYLQGLWSGFWILLPMALLTIGGACWLIHRPDVMEGPR